MRNFLFTSFTLLLFVSCQTSQQAAMADSSAIRPLSLQGTFQSTRGIKTPLSCYCYDGGYLKTTAGATIAICLDGLDARTDCGMLKPELFIRKMNN